MFLATFATLGFVSSSAAFGRFFCGGLLRFAAACGGSRWPAVASGGSRRLTVGMLWLAAAIYEMACYD